MLFPRGHDEGGEGGPAFVLLLGLVAGVLLLGEAYRWPLMVNSSAVSPGYADTPFALQAPKYVALLLVAIALALLLRRVVLDRVSISLGALALYMLIRIACYREWGEWHGALDYAAPLIAAVPFVLLLKPTVVVIRVARAAVVVFVLLNAAAIAVQMVAYAGWGRVPALSYAGGLVRFGGIWDDPNASGVTCALVIVGALAGLLNLSRRYAVAILVLASAELIVSVSLSGVLALAVGLFYLIRRAGLRLAIVLMTAAGTGILFSGWINPSTAGRLGEVVNAKRLSALERLAHVWPAFRLPWVFIGSPSLGGSDEIAVVAIIPWFGLVGLGALLAWVLIVWRASPRDARAVLLAAGAASLALPLLSIFPIGTALVIFGSLAARRIAAQYDGERVPESTPSRKVTSQGTCVP